MGRTERSDRSPPVEVGRKPIIHLLDSLVTGRKSAKTYRFHSALRRMNERRSDELRSPVWSASEEGASNNLALHSHVRSYALPMATTEIPERHETSPGIVSMADEGAHDDRGQIEV
jgi:hypothetical protein